MIKINKTKAKEVFNNGGTVYIIPCKVRFDSMWIQPVAIDYRYGTFDAVVNEFEYYNCTSETGRYSHFYVK